MLLMMNGRAGLTDVGVIEGAKVEEEKDGWACACAARNWISNGNVMMLLLGSMLRNVDLSAVIEMICPMLQRGV